MTYTQAVEKACNGDSTGFEFLAKVINAWFPAPID